MIEKLKQIWEIAWPIIKLLPKFLFNTPLGRRVLAVVIVAAAKAIGLSLSDDEVIKALEWFLIAGIAADGWRVRTDGMDATKKLFYEQKFQEWFGVHGVASEGGVIFHEDGRYFKAVFDNDHWLIMTEDEKKSKTIFEKGRDKLIELCKSL